jgi:hypothetical protein
MFDGGFGLTVAAGSWIDVIQADETGLALPRSENFESG